MKVLNDTPLVTIISFANLKSLERVALDVKLVVERVVASWQRPTGSSSAHGCYRWLSNRELYIH